MIKFISLIVCLLFGSIGHSQIDDSQLWTGFTLGLSPNKKWSFDLEQQARYRESFTFHRTFTQLGLTRRMSKRWNFTLSYRHTLVPQDVSRKRLMMDFSYANKKKRDFRFGMRFRLQNSVTSITGNHKSYARFKLKFGYNLSKLVDPFVAGEGFFRIISKNEYRGWRATAGLKWRLHKRFSLSTYARIDETINVAEPSTVAIYGLMFNYKPKLNRNKNK